MNLFDKKQNEIMRESLEDLYLVSLCLCMLIIISFLSVIF